MWLLVIHLDVVLEVAPTLHHMWIMVRYAERWSGCFLLFERKATTHTFVAHVWLPIAVE